MSKFEQLLDLIVNEEHDKANELFHEIVVEKSREIYENLIAQEAENDVEEATDDVEESADDVEEATDDVEESMDDDVEESADDVEESMDDDVEESMDDEPEMEDAYSLEGDDEEEMPEPSGMEKTDDLEGDVGSDEEVEFDIKSAIEQLQAALDKMEGGMGGDMGDEMPDDAMPGAGGPEELKMGFAEGKRMTREYVEKVGNDWDKNSQKTQADYVGAKSGDVEGKPVEGKSPIASGSNKPGPAGVNAKNLNQSHHEGGTPTGTSPAKVNKGINPESSEKFASGIHNVDGKKSGVKTLSNVKGGHGAEKKGAGPGPVGSGTGDKAGQTSVKPVPQMLKPYSK